MNETLFSPCRLYRYTLWREFEPSPPSLFMEPEFDEPGNPDFDELRTDTVERRPGFVNFLMLNPSTADETLDDPTIRRCMGYAADWGYSQLCVTNIFAFRATDPKVMRSQKDPVGPDNDRWLSAIANDAGLIITAWGAHGEHNGRGAEVIARMIDQCSDKLHYLKMTNGGQPSHPLYLPRVLMPIKWKV